jgi:hypothetical protein
MKKLGILTLAVVMVAMFTLPATAVEHQFGGSWWARFNSFRNMDGKDAGAIDDVRDLSAVENRTRVEYTAVLNDNLKLVNRFEMDSWWGDPGTYGDIGADGVDIEVARTYIDFNMGPANFKVGVFPETLNDGYIIDDDHSGATAEFDMGMGSVELIYVKTYEGLTDDDVNDDADFYAVAANLNLAEGISLAPTIALYHTDEARDGFLDSGTGTDMADVYYGGLTFDGTFGPASVGFTGIYQGGEVDVYMSSDDFDISAYLLKVDFNVDLGMLGVHGEVLYATGQDPDEDDEITQFLYVDGMGGNGWAEILGEGDFWNVSQPSNAPVGTEPANIMYAGAGVTVKPVEDISLTFDLWYAELIEGVTDDNGDEVNDLGLEIDAKLSMELIEDLNLDLVAAYLLAGDAINPEDDDDEADPFEVGAILSLSF